MRWLIALAVSTGFLGFDPALADAGARSSAGRGLQQRFFLSPSGNISCELDYDPGSTVPELPTGAFCQAIKPARSVKMSPTGRLKICRGVRCLGNPPENAFTLNYGRSTSLGPFKCRSVRPGMRCRVRSGRGFLISRSGIDRL